MANTENALQTTDPVQRALTERDCSDYEGCYVRLDGSNITLPAQQDTLLDALGVGAVGDDLFTAATADDALTALGAGDVGKSLLQAQDGNAARAAIGDPIKLVENVVPTTDLSTRSDGYKVNIIGRAAAYDRPEDVLATLQSSFDFARDGWGGPTVMSKATGDGRYLIRQRHAKEVVTLPDADFWGDGTRDCSGIINDLLAQGGSEIVLVLPRPKAFYYCDNPIIVPAGRSLIGDYGQAFQTYRGTRVKFRRDMGGACIDMRGAPTAGNIPSYLKGLVIVRDLTYGPGGVSGGVNSISRILSTRAEIPSGSVGLRMGCMAGAVVEDVHLIGHDRGLEWPLTVTAPDNSSVTNTGLGIWYNRLGTGIIKGSHLALYAGVEQRFNQCRFGMSGTWDVQANEYIRVGGVGGNGGTGIDSLIMVNCQFNEGAPSDARAKDTDGSGDPDGVAAPKRVLYYDDYGDDGVFIFQSCHFEAYKRLISASVGTPRAIFNVNFSNCYGNQAGGNSVNLGRQQLENVTGGLIRQLKMSDCRWVGSWTFEDAHSLQLTNNEFLGGSIVFDGVQAGAVSNNWMVGSVSLTGAMGVFSYTGNIHQSAGTPFNALTNNSTGVVSVMGNTYKAGYTHPDIDVMASNYLQWGAQGTFTIKRFDFTLPSTHTSNTFTVPNTTTGLASTTDVVVGAMARNASGTARVRLEHRYTDGANSSFYAPLSGNDVQGRQCHLVVLRQVGAFPTS